MVDHSQARVFLLPGLGADFRLFGPQQSSFSHLQVLKWIPPLPRESLAGYGERLARRFEDPESPYVLGGASMGGMVALEMARHLRPTRLALIGSAASGREIRGFLCGMERIGRAMPNWVIESARVFAPNAASLLFSVSSADRQLFLSMLGETPTSFLRWASRAIVEWDPSTMPDVPIDRIHGACDRIIRPPAAESATLVQGAGHLVSLTHPDEVNAWLRGIMQRVA